MNRRRELLKRVSGGGGLPEEYQQVDYIKGDGNSWIDTGYVPTNESGIKLDATQTISTDNVILGLSQSTTNRWNIGSISTSQIGGVGIYSGWQNVAQSYRSKIYVETEFTFCLNYMNDRKRWLGNVEQNDSYMNTTISPTLSAYIFARHESNGAYYKSQAKIHDLEFSEGTEIVRHFIPCYRKSDGEIGMYDIVSNTFLTNQGTGTFEKGGDV